MARARMRESMRPPVGMRETDGVSYRGRGRGRKGKEEKRGFWLGWLKQANRAESRPGELNPPAQLSGAFAEGRKSGRDEWSDTCCFDWVVLGGIPPFFSDGSAMRHALVGRALFRKDLNAEDAAGLA